VSPELQEVHNAPNTSNRSPLRVIKVVARPRSLTKNQYPVALNEPGKAGDSLIPGSIRESKMSSNPLTIAVMKPGN